MRTVDVMYCTRYVTQSVTGVLNPPFPPPPKKIFFKESHAKLVKDPPTLHSFCLDIVLRTLLF